jgi:hypothetical protein
MLISSNSPRIRQGAGIERDYFYDGGFHGLDLEAAEKRYELFVVMPPSAGTV